MKAPEQGILRVGGGNIYVGNPEPRKAIGIAAATRSHSWGWSEGNNIGHLLRDPKVARGYHPLTSFGFADPKDADDCSMMVRKRLHVEHFSMTKVCDDVPGSKVGHARTFSMLAYAAPMLGDDVTACHIAIHPNWVQGFDGPGSQVVEEYVESNEALDAMLTFAAQMGWLRSVTGDFNLRKASRKPFPTTYEVFADHRLAVKMDGIDGVAYDRSLVLDDWTLIPKKRTKTDHDNWTVADFRRKGARRA